MIFTEVRGLELIVFLEEIKLYQVCGGTEKESKTKEIYDLGCFDI